MAENTYFFYFLTFIFILGVWIYLPACTSVYHMHAMPVETIRGHQIPVLELYMIVNCSRGAGSETQVLWKSNQCA